MRLLLHFACTVYKGILTWRDASNSENSFQTVNIPKIMYLAQGKNFKSLEVKQINHQWKTVIFNPTQPFGNSRMCHWWSEDTISSSGLIRWPKSTSLSRSSSHRFGANSSNMVSMATRVETEAGSMRSSSRTKPDWNLESKRNCPCVSRSSNSPLCFIRAI